MSKRRKHFLMQKGKNGQVLHDFAFRLIEAIRFAEWKYGQEMYDLSFSFGGETLDVLFERGVQREDVIPIGSLEFVLERMAEMEYEVHQVKPLNVPELLNKPDFLNRSFHKGMSKHELLHHELTMPLFIKSADRYKGFTDIVESHETLHDLSSVERFDVSQVVDIEEEWRVFVQQDEIIGAKPYGSRTLFPKAPNLRFLKRMTQTIEKARDEGELFPLSYTLDVGVSLDGSFLIECHPFVSCGLYGFDELERLPSMLIQGYAYLQQQCENKGG